MIEAERDGASGARLAVQLYTLRNAGLDFDGMLQAVARAGYDGVETVHPPDRSARDLRETLARHGLTPCSSHVPLARLAEAFDETTDFYLEAGVDTLVVPFLPRDERPGDADGWVDLGRRLGALAERCETKGLSLLYHNHEFEFEVVGGENALTHLLHGTSALGLELDLGWTARAGSDPLRLLQRWSSRIPRVHVKDVAPAGRSAEGGWADVGHGTVEWPPVLRAARAAGAHWWIVEHDEPSDPVASIERSARYLSEFA